MPLFPFFRRQAPQEPTIVAMTGVRLGQRLLIVAERDPSIPSLLGAKTGLTGRVLALGADQPGAAGLETRAQADGVLIDSAVLALPLPTEDGTFDVAVVDGRHERAIAERPLLAEVRRALRPGGRIIVLKPAGGRWTQGLFGHQPDPPDVSAVTDTLAEVGFQNARLVGVRDGMAFVEAFALSSTN